MAKWIARFIFFLMAAGIAFVLYLPKSNDAIWPLHTHAPMLFCITLFLIYAVGVIAAYMAISTLLAWLGEVAGFWRFPER